MASAFNKLTSPARPPFLQARSSSLCPVSSFHTVSLVKNYQALLLNLNNLKFGGVTFSVAPLVAAD